MRIETKTLSELEPMLQRELKARVDREFGSIPIVCEHVWAEPNWVLMGFVDDCLATFLNIVDRKVLADGEPQHFFGLNNVITEPSFRSHGYSKLLNQAAIQFMLSLDDKACGFLFCADEMIPFYSDLGWKRFEGKVTVAQPKGEKLWPSNAMSYDLSGRRSWKTINLCGLPW